jgi:RNA-binding protein
MRRVGEVVRSAQGLAVVRSADAQAPDVGTALVDESLSEIGEVVAVFGPVERPYAAVSPGAEPVARLVGSPVYARESR